MKRTKPLPQHCLVVRTYGEFREVVRAFGQEAYELMCIFGGPGLGKSETVKREMQTAREARGWWTVRR